MKLVLVMLLIGYKNSLIGCSMNKFVITHSGSTYYWLEYHVSKDTLKEAVEDFLDTYPLAVIHRILIDLDIRELITN